MFFFSVEKTSARLTYLCRCWYYIYFVLHSICKLSRSGKMSPLSMMRTEPRKTLTRTWRRVSSLASSAAALTRRSWCLHRSVAIFLARTISRSWVQGKVTVAWSRHAWLQCERFQDWIPSQSGMFHHVIHCDGWAQAVMYNLTAVSLHHLWNGKIRISFQLQ